MLKDQAIRRLLDQPAWQVERARLRALLLQAGLAESVKWGKLCYGLEGRNIALIFGLKAYCALGFLKGSLLEDPEGDLVSPGPHSQAMRQLRFTDIAAIDRREGTILAFIGRAVAAERAGLSVDFTAAQAPAPPEELTAALSADPEMADAFARLTPGRQRGWLLHVGSARQPETRLRRIAAIRPRILAGQGPSDR